jgi:hypothetical protein
MAYVKNYPAGWADSPAETTPITAATLDNIETQYTEAVATAAADVDSDITTHAADTSTHGAADIADVSDIAVDANLSAAAQAAVSARHTQGTDTTLGTMAADIVMNTNKITGMGDPSSAQDAATKNYVDNVIAGGIPSGIICMWGGLVANIPSGWLLCDGANGTPNLADKFIKGTTSNPGATGGAATHTHNSHPSLSHTGCAVAAHSNLSHSGCSVDSHGTLTHSGCSVASHTGLTHTNGAVANHTGLTHSGTAVGNHSNLSHSGLAIADHPETNTGSETYTANAIRVGPSNGSSVHYHVVPALAHSITTPYSAHSISAHSVTQPDAHGSAGTLTHTVTQPDAHGSAGTLTHTVTQASSHGTLTHTVTQASAHTISAHSVTQATAHSSQSHSSASNEPAYYALCFIQKS